MYHIARKNQHQYFVYIIEKWKFGRTAATMTSQKTYYEPLLRVRKALSGVHSFLFIPYLELDK